MFLFILNELSIGIFFYAEYDAETDHVAVTFFEKRPDPKRGIFILDHLRHGQAARLTDFGDWKTWSADVSHLSFNAKIEDEVGNHGVLLKLKMKNGSHRTDKNHHDSGEFEIVFTPEDDNNLPN